jgi:REP element-mobilizing transposase RayT
LHAYLGGILNNVRGKLLVAGGMQDHIHVLASMPATASLAEGAAVMKANSSRFIHEELGAAGFDWQKGYAAFSVSISMEETVRNYILNQKRHHARRSFQDEYLDFLNRHHIEYDPQHLFL